MFEIIIIMLKCTASVVGRVDVRTDYFASKVLFKSLQSKQVIAVNEHVLRIVLAVGLGRVFYQYSWLKLRLFAFTNPRQFKFLLLISHGCSNAFINSLI